MKNKSWSKWTPDRIELLKNIYLTSSKQEILEKLGGSWVGIQARARKLGLNKPFDYSVLRKGDATPLLLDTPEAYYWIGYLFADGHLSKKELSITCSIIDKDHLHRFANFINCSLQKKKNFSKKYDYVSVRICHREVIDQLREKFELNNRKTYEPPSTDIFAKFSDELFICWLIGFIDGDGCIVDDQISIENHASWIDIHRYIVKILNEKYDKDIPTPKINSKGYSRLYIRSKATLELRKMIKDKNLPVLGRKWNQPKRIKMNLTTQNPLNRLDQYKCNHQEQYCPGASKVYSYLMARSDTSFDKISFFGLQYYLKEYLSVKLTPEMGENFIQTQEGIFGKCSDIVKNNIRALCKLGHYPLEIKAVEEGTIVPAKNALMTITNTLPEFYWVPGFIESLILKVWYPITVASASFRYRELMEKYWQLTASESIISLKPFLVHDFGYRSSETEEGAALSGVAHLTNFMGSDTIPARGFAIEYYGAKDPILLSAMASEHSCVCSYGRENEFQAFERMLDLYPDGIVSMVSDSFDIYGAVTKFLPKLKDRILARDGVYVTRPDSGYPEHILCGDPDKASDTPEGKGVIRLLDEIFGSSVNEKGFKQLNPKVGCLYGDGIFIERYDSILNRLKEMGYASSNLVIGVGALLRYFSRDSIGAALKATYVEINGQPREIEKDPVTDRKKKSHKGLIQLIKHADGSYETRDQVTWEKEKQGELKTVFLNGQITREFTLSEIREKVNSYFSRGA